MSERRDKVLVVDNAPIHIALLGEALGGDHEVLIATSGEKGLAAARTHRPDLILLDIMMDGLDGYEVCRRLKADAATADIPVIFLTAKDSVTDEAKGFALGAVDYVTKPFSPATVRARVHTHLELKRRRDELVLLTEMKNRFLAIAAHDLRSPLASMVMLTEMFVEDARALVPAPKLAYLERVVSGGHHLLSLLNGLLDVSTIEKGRFAVDLERASLAVLLDERIRLLKPLTDRKSLAVETELGEVPEFALDANRVSQTFDNVFTNAIKYSPKGARIRVRLFARGEHAQVEVADEGPGLTPAEQVHAFGEYQTAGARPTGNESSTGLGLYIVKKIVEAHGGRVWMDSTPGQGTTIAFTLPIAR